MLCYNRPHVLHARIAQFNRVAVYKTSVSVTTWEMFLNETEEFLTMYIILIIVSDEFLPLRAEAESLKFKILLN